MNYYLIHPNNNYPWRLAKHSNLGWSWVNASGNGFPFHDNHLNGEDTIVYAPNREEIGGPLSNVTETLEAGLLNADGHFYPCYFDNHRALVSELSQDSNLLGDGEEGWILVNKDGAQSLQNRVFFDNFDDITPAQIEVLETLGFDVEIADRMTIPDYDDVFSDENPPHPKRDFQARVVTDMQEIRDWMAANEPAPRSAPGY